MDRSQHNVKKRYGGGRGEKISKKRDVVVEQPLSMVSLRNNTSYRLLITFAF